MSQTLQSKPSIFSYTSAEFMEQQYREHGRGKLHALHLYKSYMKKGVWDDLDPMFSNAKNLYQLISDSCDRSQVQISNHLKEGETEKFIFSTQDGYLFESVAIPMQHGRTLCVSSQVGCKMGCVFCETGRMGLLRNLEPFEIVQQAFITKIVKGIPVHNIVFMGMGEPFDNYDSVMQSIDILTDQNGLAFGMGNITVSTSGKTEGVYRLADDRQKTCNLAVSLNAAQSDLRTKLMPYNRREGLDQLHQSIAYYNRAKGKEVMIAYVMMDGVNSTLEHAESLFQFIQGLEVRINLIPYNPQRNDRFKRPLDETIELFSQFLQSKGVQVLYRKTRGSSIMAACGQLGGKKQQGSLPLQVHSEVEVSKNKE